MHLPIYFISDNHFYMENCAEEKHRRNRLYNLFTVIRKTGGSLVIGGDFFDFWFDYGHVIPKYYTDILEHLAELYQNGIEIHYLAGNHDYWDFGCFSEKFGAVFHPGDFSFEQSGQRILVTHGDGLLKNDRAYRLMKKVIRSRLCIFLFSQYHPDWGCALAKKVSRTSGEHHHTDAFRNLIHRDVSTWSTLRWEEGYDTVLVGHYHQTGIHTKNSHRLIWMGDWIKHFTVTRFDGIHWTQKQWNIQK